MASPKRPKLFETGEAARTGPRDAVCIPGICKVGGRPAEEVLITDISPSGCKVRLVTVGAVKSEPVTLTFAGVASIGGRLKWIRQAAVGVQFDAPVDEPTLALLLALVPDNVVPIRRTRLG